MRRSRLAHLALTILGLLPGCTLLPPIDFQRMIYQDRFQVWQHCAWFEDGRAMRTPPAGTLPRDERLGDPALTEGIVAGAYVERIPLPLTRPVLDAGAARFDVYCAPCHGLRGDGEAVVADTMNLRRPRPSSARPRRRSPPGASIRSSPRDMASCALTARI